MYLCWKLSVGKSQASLCARVARSYEAFEVAQVKMRHHLAESWTCSVERLRNFFSLFLCLSLSIGPVVKWAYDTNSTQSTLAVTLTVDHIKLAIFPNACWKVTTSVTGRFIKFCSIPQKHRNSETPQLGSNFRGPWKTLSRSHRRLPWHTPQQWLHAFQWSGQPSKIAPFPRGIWTPI